MSQIVWHDQYHGFAVIYGKLIIACCANMHVAQRVQALVPTLGWRRATCAEWDSNSQFIGSNEVQMADEIIGYLHLVQQKRPDLF